MNTISLVGCVSRSVVDCLLILNDILNRFRGPIYQRHRLSFSDLLVCKDPAAHLFKWVQPFVNVMWNAKRDHLLLGVREIANSCDLNYRISKNKRLLLELTLIRLCQLSGELTRLRRKKSEQTNSA